MSMSRQRRERGLLSEDYPKIIRRLSEDYPKTNLSTAVLTQNAR